jgi:diguanylate cyclase (GGDEF)-like protein
MHPQLQRIIQRLAASGQVGALRALLLMGAVLAPIVWWVERRAGIILPWDEVLLPYIALGLGAFAAWLHWRPQHLQAVATGAVLMLSSHMSCGLLAMLLLPLTGVSTYQIVTILGWMLVSYGVAFVFLPLKRAISICLGLWSLSFFPLAAAVLLRWDTVGRWPADSIPLLFNTAALHLAVMVLLLAVAQVRLRAASAEADLHSARELAATDVLTGLPNRRSVDEALAAATALAQRSGQPLSVALVDIDHFKRINDRHGHALGDAVLVQMAELLRREVRGADRVGRWGGEEFLLVAPNTRLAAALDLLERLRRAMAAQAFSHGEAVSISAGVTQYLPGDRPLNLLERADAALYRAKTMGRNRVEVQAVGQASSKPEQAA